MSNRAFYTSHRGDNYAQARYLLYYLQENGLLRKYYRLFLANRKTDPTGYRTLQVVLDEKDMAKFQKRWEAYVMKLTFPSSRSEIAGNLQAHRTHITTSGDVSSRSSAIGFLHLPHNP